MLVNLNPVRKRTKKNIEINTSDAKQSEKQIQQTFKNERKLSINKPRCSKWKR